MNNSWILDSTVFSSKICDSNCQQEKCQLSSLEHFNFWLLWVNKGNIMGVWFSWNKLWLFFFACGLAWVGFDFNLQGRLASGEERSCIIKACLLHNCLIPDLVSHELFLSHLAPMNVLQGECFYCLEPWIHSPDEICMNHLQLMILE